MEAPTYLIPLNATKKKKTLNSQESGFAVAKGLQYDED